MKIKLNLKKYRLEKGLTQKDLASKLGITYQMISAYENGKIIPSLERAIQMALILGITLDEFVIYQKH